MNLTISSHVIVAVRSIHIVGCGDRRGDHGLRRDLFVACMTAHGGRNVLAPAVRGPPLAQRVSSCSSESAAGGAGDGQTSSRYVGTPVPEAMACLRLVCCTLKCIAQDVDNGWASGVHSPCSDGMELSA